MTKESSIKYSFNDDGKDNNINKKKKKKKKIKKKYIYLDLINYD